MELHGIEIVSRVIIIQNNAILVCRAEGKGHYFLPGGHIEFGETTEQSLVRELKEESGLDLTVGEYIGSLENFFTQNGEKHHEYSFVFTGSLKTDTVSSLESHISFTWIPLDQLTVTNIQPEQLKNRVILWLDDQKVFWDTQAEKN
jgi:8-oxo-dGTP pyrophosphatase MutT (NUDIX family)